MIKCKRIACIENYIWRCTHMHALMSIKRWITVFLLWNIKDNIVRFFVHTLEVSGQFRVNYP